MDLLTIVCVILAFSCSVNAQKPDRERDDLFGAVSMVRTEKQKDGVTTIDEVTYSRNGNKSLERNLKPDGTLISRDEYEYDDRSQLKSVTSFDGRGATNKRRTFRQINDSPVRAVEETIVGGDELPSRKVLRFYDAAGRPVEMKDLGSDGKLQERILTSYDSRGKPAEVSFFTEANALSLRIIFINDAKGNPTETDYYSGDGSPAGKMVFSGDTEKGSDMMMTEYDATENLAGKTHIVNEFDSQGNWIKQTVSKWSPQSGAWEVTEVTRRTITYY